MHKVMKCPHCGGTNVETKAWVKYEKGQFVISTYCEEGWTCWDCDLGGIDVEEVGDA
jgi:hypothetical protein